jgi:hypothetical protein
MGSKSYSKGISWIDDCRIPFVGETLNGGGYGGKNMGTAVYALSDGRKTKPTNKLKKEDFVEPQGRFPANLLVSDDMLNDGVITQYNKNRTDNGTYLGGHRKEYVGTDDNDVVKQIKGQFFNDKGTNSRYYDIDKWFDNLIDV